MLIAVSFSFAFCVWPLAQTPLLCSRRQRTNQLASNTMRSRRHRQSISRLLSVCLCVCVNQNFVEGQISIVFGVNQQQQHEVCSRAPTCCCCWRRCARYKKKRLSLTNNTTREMTPPTKRLRKIRK